MNPTTADNLLKLGQAARAAGVSTQTLEYYIMLGLVTPINHPPGSRRRFFDADLVKRIRLIRELLHPPRDPHDLAAETLANRPSPDGAARRASVRQLAPSVH